LDRLPDSSGARGALPWYRHFHVWLLIAFPALSVAGGIATLWLAFRTDDGLVADDYYRQGMEINLRMERDRHAVAAGLDADLEFERASGRIRVALRARQGFPQPEVLRLSFMHPTRAGLDRTVRLDAAGPMFYEGALPELEPARWYAVIEADDWRLVKVIDRR
jgi:hypothetical protein